MKSILILLVAGCFLLPVKPTTLPLATTASNITAAVSDSLVVGVFDGKSPCQEIAKDLHRAVKKDCFKLKWRLTLYQDAHTLTPTTYTMEGTFYRRQTREGRWTIIKGTKTDPEAIVYQLDPDRPQSTQFFLKADDNVLFFLDKNRNLLVGNANFSYTLNRVAP